MTRKNPDGSISNLKSGRKRKSGRKLRSGFTTGAAAAAAAKAALTHILGKKVSGQVRIELFTGNNIIIPVNHSALQRNNTAIASVIKDAGDDPDITHKAEIGAKVTVLDKKDDQGIVISGGLGVGRITKPGLEIDPGEAAINLGPRRMITNAVDEVRKKYGCNKKILVEVFVPEGEKLARNTLNPRLGIIGGISILGTTGIVKPMSHEAYIATIKSSLSVAGAADIDSLVFTTGRRSERFAQNFFSLPEESFIQIGDFFKASLEAASHQGFKIITLASFFGKAVKQAQGIAYTHAAKSELTMHRLSDWSLEITNDPEFAKKILSANTARHAFDFIIGIYPAIISRVGRMMIKSAKKFMGPSMTIHSIIFDYKGKVIFDSRKNGKGTD